MFRFRQDARELSVEPQVTTQIDQNLMVMQIIEEVAARNNLAALIQEKPFGAPKHTHTHTHTHNNNSPIP